MRHRVKRSRLSLSRSPRKALLESLAKAVLLNGRIKTTHRRAKNVRPLVDHLISLGKNNTLAAKRKAYAVLQDHLLVVRLFGEIAPKFKDRAGGYSRVLLLSKFRRGDGTEMAFLELTETIREKKSEAVKKEKLKHKEVKTQAEKTVSNKEALEKKEGIIATPLVDEKPKQEKPKSAPVEERKDRQKEISDKKKTHKKFLGGLRNFFRKERDSL